MIIGEAFINILNKKLEALIRDISELEVLPVKIEVDFFPYICKAIQHFDHHKHTVQTENIGQQYIASFKFTMEYYVLGTSPNLIDQMHEKLASYSEGHKFGLGIKKLYISSSGVNYGNQKNVKYVLPCKDDLWEPLKNDIYSFMPKINLEKMSNYIFEYHFGSVKLDDDNNYIITGKLLERYVKAIENPKSFEEQEDDER